jgi:hypothetical protein
LKRVVKRLSKIFRKLKPSVCCSVTKILGKIIDPILGKSSPNSHKPSNAKIILKVQIIRDNKAIKETDRWKDRFEKSS